jgi:DNA-binding NtrC family response regulator
MSLVILVVDEETHFLKTLSVRLEAEGFLVRTCMDAEQAISLVEETHIDVVVLGDPANGRSGLESLRSLKAVRPELDVILLATHASVEYSIQAMKLGACDCLPKPTSIQDLVERIHQTDARKSRPFSGTSARSGRPEIRLDEGVGG